MLDGLYSSDGTLGNSSVGFLRPWQIFGQIFPNIPKYSLVHQNCGFWLYIRAALVAYTDSIVNDQFVDLNSGQRVLYCNGQLVGENCVEQKL